MQLTNAFHRTSVEVSDEWGNTPGEAWVNLQNPNDEEAVEECARVREALCGIEGCTCGVVR